LKILSTNEATKDHSYPLEPMGQYQIILRAWSFKIVSDDPTSQQTWSLPL
jgi:hypothetical protein